MLDRSFDKVKNIHSLYELRLPVLFFGLALWFVIPIVGIFPILLSIQLELLNPRRQKSRILSSNNLLLILVVLSVSIYLSSFDVFADTRVYLNLYQLLDTKGIFDNFIVRNRYEFVIFLIFYPINILTNGSEYWCLFLFSLFCNSLVVFYLSKKLSRKYYPSLLIIVFSTSYYYSQIFYMRQFVSIMFLLMALACIDSSWLIFILWSFLATFAHLTSFVYVSILLAIRIAFNLKSKIKIKLQKKDKLLIYVSLGFILIILGYAGLKIVNNPTQIYGYVERIVNLLPNRDLGNALQTRVDNNDGRDVELFTLTEFRLIAIMSIGCFIAIQRFKKLTPKRLSFYLFYIVSIFQIVFILATGFNQRIVYVFLAFYGLFFNIGLDDRSLVKPFGAVSLLTMFMAAANTFNFLMIQDNMLDLGGWTFFEGQPLTASIFEYIFYFFKSI